MDLRHLRCFVAVAEELNFRRAAARLHIAPPPLSRTIRELERELGTQLLERTTRRVVLTDDGRRLLGQATAILAQAEAVTNGDGGPARTRLRVAMVADSNDTARRILQTLHGDHPELTVDRVTMTSRAARQGLLDGTLDGAVGRAEPVTGLTALAVRDERLAVLVRGDHRLAGRDAVALAELRDDPLYLPPEDEAPAWHRFVVDMFARAGVAPPLIEARYGRGPAAFADVVERFGHVAVVVGSDEPGRSAVVRVPIADDHAIYPWSAIVATRRPCPEPVAWFLAAALATARRAGWTRD